MTRLPPVALLGGSANAVSVTRSLGRWGVPVHAIGERRTQVAYSRYCATFTAAGGREAVQGRWLDWLLAPARAGAVVLACDDDGLELVARNRARLVAHGLLPFEADDAVLLEMLDKERTLELARELGVPAPRTTRVSSAADLDEAACEFEPPFLLKPVHGHVFRRASAAPVKAVVVADEAGLAAARRLMEGLETDMSVGEIVPGPDDSLYFYSAYLDEGGEPLVEYVERQLRQYPPGFGVASYRISVDDDEIATLGRRFLQEVGVRGLAQLEFKRDARDGRPMLIECNHRFGAGNELTRLAGIDLARISYARITGLEVPGGRTYRTGLRLWHPLDDLRAARTMRREGSLSAAAWARSLCHRKRFAVFRVDDPMPTIGYYSSRVRTRFRKIGRTGSGRTG